MSRHTTVLDMWTTPDQHEDAEVSDLLSGRLDMSLGEDLDMPELPGMDAVLLSPDGPDLVLDSHLIDVNELYGGAYLPAGLKSEPASPPSPSGSDSGMDNSPPVFEYGDTPPVTPPQPQTLPTSSGSCALAGRVKQEVEFIAWKTEPEICFEDTGPAWPPSPASTAAPVAPARSLTAPCLSSRSGRPSLPSTHTYIITRPTSATAAAAAPLTSIVALKQPTVGPKPVPLIPRPAPVVSKPASVVHRPPPVVHRPAPVVSTPAQVVVTAARPDVRHLDPRALKRQERMIKNRMAACLSRKKRKDQFAEMEVRTKQLEAENSRLREENQQLHRQLAQLAAEVDMLRQSQTPASPPPSPRRPLILLSVLLLASINLAPIRSLVWGPLPVPFDPDAEGAALVGGRPGGRTLLWAAPSPLSDISGSSQEGGSSTHNNSAEVTCPRYNQTEARRLSRVLHGWFDPVQRRRARTGRRRASQTERALAGSHLPSSDQYYSRRRPAALRPYLGPLAAFMAQVGRRDDTFYVVWLDGQRLLLPALVHNQTRRPQMALLLPSPPLNESMRAPEDFVAMIQIDCEVTNTKLLHIPEASLPASAFNASGGLRNGADASRDDDSKLSFDPAALDAAQNSVRKPKTRTSKKRLPKRKKATRWYNIENGSRKFIHERDFLEVPEMKDSAPVS